WTLPEHLHHSNWVTDRAAEFLCRYRDPTCPFFLHISYWAPHPPAIPPQCYWDRYTDVDYRPAIGDWVHPPPHQPGIAPTTERGPFTIREMQEHAAGYWGLINHIDDQLNHLIDRWNCSPLHERDRPTWLLFTSDHGEQLGEHHLFRKRKPYQGSCHVPLFISPLDGAACEPRASAHPASLEDILPTCCELAGIPAPPHLGPQDGRSLAPILQGGSNGREETWGSCAALGQWHHYLVHDGWKYIRWMNGEEQCFDLRTDPHECQDRSGNADAVAPLRTRMLTIASSCGRDLGAEPRPLAGSSPRALWGRGQGG
ncbi:MAG: sulfatase-like hydrolase/transferase, partial [Planctomycetota bacterium]